MVDVDASQQAGAAPRRSDATRAAILAAARERFAADGYERATIRAIAADAKIDPSMVMRYYGNKEKLFAAAADYALDLPNLTGIPPEQLGRVLITRFIDLWERDDKLRALLRVATTNEAAAARMRSIFSEQVAPIVAAVSPDPAQVPLRAGLLATQALGLAICRYVLELPPVVAMSRDEVIAWLAPNVQHVLTGSPA
jgi:AcrR family transcriptional regulator